MTVSSSGLHQSAAALAATDRHADTAEAEQHHRPRCGFGNCARVDRHVVELEAGEGEAGVPNSIAPVRYTEAQLVIAWSNDRVERVDPVGVAATRLVALARVATELGPGRPARDDRGP